MKKANLKSEEMKAVRDDILALTNSPLYDFRVENGYFPVVGEGNLDAHIVFVGEAPGKNEAEKDRPFCGASGRILDELLASIGMDRAKVYITNLVKDRPPENRDPSRDEIALYAPFLDRQIAIIEPRIIATLGRHPMKYIFERFGLSSKLKPISQIHGKGFKATGPHGEVTIIALYHPAAALYNGSIKKDLVKDFKILKKYV
ncbi:MAG: uracil-DNA glycosylase [bacterium]|nr:uracil-DNA glycosylase [bacterium]